VPTSATRASLLQGGAVDIAQYPQPLSMKLRDQKACRRQRRSPS
jgi:hypothetical protein